MSAARHLALRGVLCRLSASSHAEAFVLRGGALMQHWVGLERRQTRDLDFLCLFPADIEESRRRLAEVLLHSADDDLAFEVDTLRSAVIWQETNFPGHRFTVAVRLGGEEQELQIDLGFEDPLVPPAEWIEYPCLVGAPARLRAVRPELLTAWKLHGLFEHGARRWQAKDLYDLWLLTTCCSLDERMLTEAIPVAFHSRGSSLDEVPGVLFNPAWWETETARRRWERFRAAAGVPILADLAEIAAAVARALRPSLG